DGKAVVREVADGSEAAKAGLKPKDVLEKIGTPGGDLIEFKGALGFLMEVRKRNPKDKVAIQVTGRAKALEVEVGQGVDERKPLFSLALVRKNKVLGWIGWTPNGPFDASGA